MNKITLGFLSKPHFREFGNGSTGRTISGYAIIFDRSSVVMSDFDGVFREYVDRGAITNSVLSKCDIQFTIWHDREMLLARHHADGTGTLKLNVDSIGVHYEFEAPRTPAGDTAVELVKRGDLIGASFSFYEVDAVYTYGKGADGIQERHIKKLNSIFEMTLASEPAYPDTTANAREALVNKQQTQLASVAETLMQNDLSQIELEQRKRNLQLGIV